MTAGLPPPNWPAVSTDGKLTVPWYVYLKSADEFWRTKVVSLTSLTTLSDPTADLIANSGVTLMQSVPATNRILESPEPGCRKTLCVVSTSTAGKVTLQSTAMIFRGQSTVAGSTGWKLVFGSSAPYKAVELLGISTFEYLIVNNVGAVTVTTT
jgi:hypothetical protein